MALIHLLNGAAFDTDNPGACLSITPEVIATSLAKQCRFNGHCQGFYSVAQHSVLVAKNVPRDAKRHALLHDAHEIILGDIIRPMKSALWNDGLERLSVAIDNAIYQSLGIDPPDQEIQDLIAIADNRALATEKRDLLSPCDWWNINAIPFAPTIRAKGWEGARASWIKHWEECRQCL